jgi:hypothetical protein
VTDSAGARGSAFAEHSSGGYLFRLGAPDVAKLRELPGTRGKSDEVLTEEFFTAQAARWAESLSDTLPPPAEIRVVVDPFSRQAFLASGRTVYSILSF